MNPQSPGKIVVISGPSGTGKTSICEALLEQIPRARWSVSVTTRPRRGREVPGASYEYVSRAEFERMIDADELLEHAEYLGNLYGTPRKPVEEAVARGEVVIMEIDVQGAKQIAERKPESLRVFILPPTMETLRSRLEGRHTESEAIQRRRLAEADGEIAFAKQSGVYQFFITNDILQGSVDRVKQIIEQEIKSG